MKTLDDVVRRLTGKKSPRTSDPKALRTQVCLTYALHRTGLNLNALANQFLTHHEDRSGLIYKWNQGQVISRKSAMRLGKGIPGLVELYDVALYELLEDRPLTIGQVRRLLKQYEGTRGSLIPWVFPNDDVLKAQRRYLPPYIREDTSRLVMRGDIYGFTAIVGLVREAEAQGCTETHLLYCADMYRALPGLGRLPWFHQHFDLLRRCIESIHARRPLSFMLLKPDWDIIRRQIEAPVHEPIRERRPRDPNTGRFAELEDPFVMCDIVDPRTRRSKP